MRGELLDDEGGLNAAGVDPRELRRAQRRDPEVDERAPVVGLGVREGVGAGSREVVREAGGGLAEELLVVGEGHVHD